MTIVFDAGEFNAAYALVKQWQARARAVRKQFLYRVTDRAYHDVLNYLPSDRKELRQSLRMQSIRGLPDSVDAYVIRSTPRGQAVARADEEATVIYVAVKSNLMRAAPEATLILEEYSPWTLETLPYAPDPKTADVMTRRVSKREVNKVRRLRTRDRPKWRRRMIEAGVRGIGRGQEPRPRETSAVPDTAFESLRLEFGLGGAPSKPHWRKAILKLALRGGAGMIARKREFTRAMTDPTYRAWEMWPRRADGYASVAEARQYVPFQKRLGLRVTGR